MLIGLLYEKKIGTENTRKLAQEIHANTKLEALNDLPPKVIDNIPMASTENEYLEFIFKATRIVDISAKCKTFPNLFTFISEFGEPLGWLITEKPNFWKENGIYEYSLKSTLSFNSKQEGIDLIMLLYEDKTIDLLTKEYLIASVEQSIVPEIPYNVLN
jgi:hypothetical protein